MGTIKSFQSASKQGSAHVEYTFPFTVKKRRVYEKKQTPTKFLLRVDDFPSSYSMECEDFLAFKSIIEKYEIPYLLGVIPYPCKDYLNPQSKTYRKLSEKEIEVLHNLENVEIGMHGVTHQTRDYGLLKKLLGFRSELYGLDEEELTKKLSKGISLFREYGFKPKTLIPPWDRFNKASITIFKKYFKIITGGSATVKEMGYCPICKIDKLIYVPSYKPWYGRASSISKFVSGAQENLICITIHWWAESKNRFKDLEKVCKLIKNKVIPWNLLSRYVKNEYG